MATVSRDFGIPRLTSSRKIATPITANGTISGRTASPSSAVRPRNRKRMLAIATRVPSTVAAVAAAAATMRLLRAAPSSDGSGRTAADWAKGKAPGGKRGREEAREGEVEEREQGDVEGPERGGSPPHANGGAGVGSQSAKGVNGHGATRR